MTDFKNRVMKVVKNIPAGETLTYKQVAELVGSPGAARAVGNLMKKNFDSDIPCHRVIKSDGSVGEYNRGGSSVKLKLLTKEASENKKS